MIVGASAKLPVFASREVPQFFAGVFPKPFPKILEMLQLEGPEPFEGPRAFFFSVGQGEERGFAGVHLGFEHDPVRPRPPPGRKTGGALPAREGPVS